MMMKGMITSQSSNTMMKKKPAEAGFKERLVKLDISSVVQHLTIEIIDTLWSLNSRKTISDKIINYIFLSSRATKNFERIQDNHSLTSNLTIFNSLG